MKSVLKALRSLFRSIYCQTRKLCKSPKFRWPFQWNGAKVKPVQSKILKSEIIQAMKAPNKRVSPKWKCHEKISEHMFWEQSHASLQGPRTKDFLRLNKWAISEREGSHLLSFDISMKNAFFFKRKQWGESLGWKTVRDGAKKGKCFK